MDEINTPEPELPETEDNPIETGENGTAAVRRPFRFEWENYLRSFFLLVIISFVGVIAWRPGVLRFSLLMALASPSHGDSLSWTPESDPLPMLPERKRVRPPEEWRLSPAYSTSWNGERPQTKEDGTNGGKLTDGFWRRYSANPWSWRDDTEFGRKRAGGENGALPPQKPASEFRAGNLAFWPAESQPAPAPVGENGMLSSLPPLPPLPSSTPGGLGAMISNLSATSPASSDASGGTEFPLLPPLPTTDRQAASPATTTPPAMPALQPIAPIASAPAGAVTDETAAETVDWKTREITSAIPGAYLTVYPKLKFIGLCVPGQGYIRKYNQVGVPEDLDDPKMAARDGRTPYGKYYIADRHRDMDGPRLYLSWPSPEDARRIGLDAGRLAEVDHAWRTQGLPPQDTAAGGGVGLTGLRTWVEKTEGGFTLEEPHMEEIYTALPDKAWVFIQQ